MICVSRGSKSRLAKAVGAESSNQVKDEKSMWHEACFQVKLYKSHHVRTNVGKAHAVVARSTHTSKSICTNQHMFGLLLGVQMPFCVASTRDPAP